MDPSLIELLSEVTDSVQLDDISGTLVSYFGPRGRYTIKHGEHSKFWTRYCQMTNDEETNNRVRKLCLGETFTLNAPVIASYTLRFPSSLGDDGTNELFSEDFIRALVFCYQEAIFEKMAISDTLSELVCCVLEASVDTIVGDQLFVRIRLQFPYCRVDLNIQKNVLRPRVIELLRLHNVISRLIQQPNNDWDEILDPKVTETAWPLYLSITNTDQPKLSMSHTYSRLNLANIDDGSDRDIAIDEAFFPTEHGQVKKRLISPDIFDEYSLEYWLPMFLSMEYCQAITIPRQTNIAPIKSSPSRSVGKLNGVKSEDKDILHVLLPALKRERVEKEYTWLDIGRVIYNVYDSSEEGLKLWIEYSERSDVYDESDCEEYYYSFRDDNPLSVKTIAWYAKEDAPDIYRDWHKNWCEPYMTQATSLTHQDVTEALYRIYWLDFVCASLEYKNWYYYDKHHWVPLDKGDLLLEKIRTDFIPRFEHLRTEFSRRIERSNEPTVKDMLEIDIKKLGELIRKLKMRPFKDAVLTESMGRFKDRNFGTFNNYNINLMGVLNGVIETCDTRAIFRPGKPEDYIDMFSPVIYNDKFTWESQKVKDFLYWLRQVFPDPDLCTYFIRLISSCLQSGNTEKIFPTHTGYKDNSKSMIKRLIDRVFGPYSFTMPTEAVTTKRQSSSNASPELAMAMMAKIAWLCEPDEEETMKGGIIKRMTGMDKMFARLLNKNGGNFDPAFVLFLMCNKIPSIPGIDDAFKERFLIVPYLSTWSKNAPLTEKEQFEQRLFPMDRNFSKKIPGMAPAALWVFVQFYADYKKNGLNKPTIVKEVTEKHWEENDVYNLFTNECIVPSIIPNSVTPENPSGTRDQNSKISLSDVYSEFKFWFNDAYPGMKVPERASVKYTLEQRWGKLRKNCWYGIMIEQKMANV
jgi:hypothetical protein